MSRVIYKTIRTEPILHRNYTDETIFKIQYTCPNCSKSWDDVHSCACDATCPKCGTKNIQALSYEEIKPNNQRTK